MVDLTVLAICIRPMALTICWRDRALAGKASPPALETPRPASPEQLTPPAALFTRQLRHNTTLFSSCRGFPEP